MTETVVEAPGTEMYKGYNRFAIYTGLPTLLGWDYQVGQQLGERTGGILQQRKLDASIIYGPDAEAAKALLKKYRARWIVVGSIERRSTERHGADPSADRSRVRMGAQAADGPSTAANISGSDHRPRRRRGSSAESPGAVEACCSGGSRPYFSSS